MTAKSAAYFLQLAQTIRSIGYQTVAANPGDRVAAQVRALASVALRPTLQGVILHDWWMASGKLYSVDGLRLGHLCHHVRDHHLHSFLTLNIMTLEPISWSTGPR